MKKLEGSLKPWAPTVYVLSVPSSSLSPPLRLKLVPLNAADNLSISRTHRLVDNAGIDLRRGELRVTEHLANRFD